MDTKKWPVLGQILIGLGVIGSLANISIGFFQKNVLNIILGIAGVVIWWSVYKLKNWALIGLNVLLSLGILMTLLNVGKIPTLILLVGIGIPVLLLIYFNSAKIKELFRQTA